MLAIDRLRKELIEQRDTARTMLPLLEVSDRPEMRALLELFRANALKRIACNPWNLEGLFEILETAACSAYVLGQQSSCRASTTRR